MAKPEHSRTTINVHICNNIVDYSFQTKLNSNDFVNELIFVDAKDSALQKTIYWELSEG